MARIELDHVSVGTPRAVRLDQVSMSIADGSFVGVIGGSGSGKSTLLRTVAGLERASTGTISFDGLDVTLAAPQTRDVGFVFQSPALIPHLSVRRNVSFPLDVRRATVDEIRRRVDAEARAMHIEDLLLRHPDQLSYGEQQMVQITRALVRVPGVLLLDEPFASLDDHLRRRLRAEIAMLQSGYEVTTLMSTNDALDVMSMTDWLAVLDHGRLVQYDRSDAVRQAPRNLLAAVATGPLSLVDMAVVADRVGSWLLREDSTGGEQVRLRAWAPGLAAHVGSLVTVGVRPPDVVVSAHGTVPAIVDRRGVGTDGEIRCIVGGARVNATVEGSRTLDPGDAVRLRFDRVMVFDKATDLAITP
jgi:ABC-type sugar transport system ATPase subunit